VQENNSETRVLAHGFNTAGAVSAFLDEGVKAEHFKSIANRKVWEAICYCHVDGSQDKGNINDVVNYIREETDDYDYLGGPSLKERLVSLSSLDLGSPRNDAKKLKEDASRREMADTLQIAAQLAQERGNDKEFSEIMGRLNQLREEITYDPLDGVMQADDLLSSLDTIDQMPDFVPTRFPSLNAAIGYDPQRGGLAKGAVHALVGAPGAGKSTFTISLLTGFLESGQSVAFANFEITESLWVKFFFANCTGCNTLRMKDYPQGFFERSKEKFSRLMKEWEDRVFIKHSHSSLFYEDIETWIRDVSRDKSIDVLIVDTLQSLEVGSRKYATRWQAYEHIMMRLERLALDLNVAVLITGQENVNRIKEGRETASISDTGGSVAIEQKSAVVMHLIVPSDEIVDWVEIQLTKNRVVGKISDASTIQFQYDDNYKGHREYVPHPTREERGLRAVSSRVHNPDASMLDD